MKDGKIIKALSGFYYVQSNGTIYPCKGRGVFRKREITPLVGDYVQFDAENNYITEIKDRQNELNRPPVANIDQALIVSSAKKPKFSSLLLNRFLVMVESIGIEPIIFINKMDLVNDQQIASFEAIKETYEKIGYPTELVSSIEEADLPRIEHYFKNKTTVIAGQSGVGKSSILNKLNPSLFIETDEISERLGRGRHTTRHVELVEVCGGLVADTPGFSTVEFTNIEADQLSDYFREMKVLKTGCKFRGCLHHKEPQCAIKQAVESGEVTKERYNHYLQFLEEIQSRKPRYS